MIKIFSNKEINVKIFLLAKAICFICFISFFACRQETIYLESDATLKFSRDTLRFDTVFTSVGSATRSFKIFNPYDKALKISRIYLENGASSIFNLNIDGISGDDQKDIEIPAKDSIYVFAEVTINPNNANNPFIINENIVFETNGQSQKVVLEAWGQNANYIPSKNNKGEASAIISDVTWDDPKPYVIYGILVIDNAKLTIAAGTRVYIHGGLVRKIDEKNKKTIYGDGLIIVQNGGSIETQGTKSKPVLIGGDRLEKDFENTPGQWNLIYIGATASAKFNYTTIKNSSFGVFVDSTAVADFYFSKIYNTAGPGIYARHATVKADNCIIYNNGASSFRAEGGDYELNYCTLANYGNNSDALLLANYRCIKTDENGKCIQFVYPDLNVKIENCIVTSSQRDAINLSQSDKSAFNYAFSNNVVRVEKLLDPKAYPTFLTEKCKDCINYTGGGRLFKNVDRDDYHLDTLSVAEQKAKPIAGFDFDLDGVPRDAQKPDIGAYEYKPK
jgi:hypothetical protein